MLHKMQDVSCTFKILRMGDFPGGPVVNTLPSNAGGASWILGQEAKIPHAIERKTNKTQKRKHKQHCKKFKKDFKNGPHQKKEKKNLI